MQKSHVDSIMYLFCLNENHCGKKKKKKKIAIVKNNIAIRIAGKVSRYIDASMNRATPTEQSKAIVLPATDCSLYFPSVRSSVFVL